MYGSAILQAQSDVWIYIYLYNIFDWILFCKHKRIFGNVYINTMFYMEIYIYIFQRYFTILHKFLIGICDTLDQIYSSLSPSLSLFYSLPSFCSSVPLAILLKYLRIFMSLCLSVSLSLCLSVSSSLSLFSQSSLCLLRVGLV